MRPVNLLPEEHRPRRASGAYSGSAYVIVGVLGAFLVMATLYVLTANQVSARQSDAADAKREAATAQAEIAKLGPFGNFTEIKQGRVASVKDLAQSRFDWERFVRELALVLPRGTWLTEVDASTTGDSATAGPSTTATATGPNAKLTGCARRQPDVAQLLVRLRKMHRVKDVDLSESSEMREGGGAAPPPPAGSSSAAGPASGQGCTGRYQFNVVVEFDEATPAATGQSAKRVPASLGGGQ